MKFHLGISMQYIMTFVRYSKKYKGGHCDATRGISIFILVRQKVKWDSLKCKEELVLDSGCDRMWQRQCFGHIPQVNFTYVDGRSWPVKTRSRPMSEQPQQMPLHYLSLTTTNTILSLPIKSIFTTALNRCVNGHRLYIGCCCYRKKLLR